MVDPIVANPVTLIAWITYAVFPDDQIVPRIESSSPSTHDKGETGLRRLGPLPSGPAVPRRLARVGQVSNLAGPLLRLCTWERPPSGDARQLVRRQPVLAGDLVGYPPAEELSRRRHRRSLAAFGPGARLVQRRATRTSLQLAAAAVQ